MKASCSMNQRVSMPIVRLFVSILLALSIAATVSGCEGRTLAMDAAGAG